MSTASWNGLCFHNLYCEYVIDPRYTLQVMTISDTHVVDIAVVAFVAKQTYIFFWTRFSWQLKIEDLKRFEVERGLEVRVDYISTCDLMWEMNGIIWEMNGIILKRRLLGSFHTAFLPRDIFWEKWHSLKLIDAVEVDHSSIINVIQGCAMKTVVDI